MLENGTVTTDVFREAFDVDVVVVGGGVAGLVAARECAHVGLSTLVLEAEPHLGGCVAGVPVVADDIDASMGDSDENQVIVDVGAESFSTRGDVVETLLDDLGLRDRVISSEAVGDWYAFPDDSGAMQVAPRPKESRFGIPASPLAEDVRAVIGWRGAFRAYADRLMPILKIGREVSLGDLVRKRMGSRVLERLVAPISEGAYSADPDLLDVDRVAPGLNQAMTRAGSLSGGIAQLLADAGGGVAVQGIIGGMNRVVRALENDLAHFGATVRTNAAVISLDPGERVADADHGGRWRLTASDRDDSAAILDVVASHVILATPAGVSGPLLASARDEWAALADMDWPAGPVVDVVTLVLDAPELDYAPRGSGVLVAAGTPAVTATALTHSTAKWRWLAEAMGPHRHVVRLLYRPETSGSADDDHRARALADVSALLGITLDDDQVLMLHRTRWQDAQAQATIGRREWLDRVCSMLALDPTVAVTGSWMTGTGLASVVAGAAETGRSIRQYALTSRSRNG